MSRRTAQRQAPVLERGVHRDDASAEAANSRLMELLPLVGTRDPATITFDDWPIYEELSQVLACADLIIPNIMFSNLFFHFENMHVTEPEFSNHRWVLGRLIIYILQQTNDYSQFEEFHLLDYVFEALRTGSQPALTDIFFEIVRIHIESDDPVWKDRFNIGFVLSIADGFGVYDGNPERLANVLHQFYQLLISLLAYSHTNDQCSAILSATCGQNRHLCAENFPHSRCSLIKLIEKLMSFNQLNTSLFNCLNLPAWLCATISFFECKDTLKATLNLFVKILENNTWNTTMGGAKVDIGMIAEILTMPEMYADDDGINICSVALRVISRFIDSDAARYIPMLDVDEWQSRITMWMETSPFSMKKYIAEFMYSYVTAAVRIDRDDILQNPGIIGVVVELVEGHVCVEMCASVINEFITYHSGKYGEERAHEIWDAVITPDAMEVMDEHLLNTDTYPELNADQVPA